MRLEIHKYPFYCSLKHFVAQQKQQPQLLFFCLIAFVRTQNAPGGSWAPALPSASSPFQPRLNIQGDLEDLQQTWIFFSASCTTPNARVIFPLVLNKWKYVKSGGCLLLWPPYRKAKSEIIAPKIMSPNREKLHWTSKATSKSKLKSLPPLLNNT